MHRIEQITEQLREVVADLDAACLEARDALRLTRVAAEAERLAAAREVTAAAAVGGDPAEARVLLTAEREGLRAARDETRRVLAHAPDAAEREARIHRNRARRSWVSREGIWNLQLQGTVALGAELQACLARYDDAAWDLATAQPTDERDTPDAIAFDGMLLMARAARDGLKPEVGKPRGRAKTRDHVVLHIDAPTLLGRGAAGKAEGPERCEIAGLGPVQAAHARALLGEAVLSILVEDGRDVRTFARPGRAKTAALAQLLEARDATCIITGCGRAARLELDHHHPVAAGGDSDDGNLHALCRQHHRRKTSSWALGAQPDHTWTLEPPPDQAHTAAA